MDYYQINTTESRHSAALSLASLTYYYFRPHRMHEMRTTAIDIPGVCQYVCLSCRRGLCENGSTDRRPVYGEDSWGPKNIVLDGDSQFPIPKGEGKRFNAAFTQLLWPPVWFLTGLRVKLTIANMYHYTNYA